jgi:allantoinase
MESLYDYGSRVGFWRFHRLFTKKKIPATVFAVGMALERNPAVCHALRETPEWEVASHGYRWIDYQNVDPETEKEHIARTVKIHETKLGKRPVGFYQGKVCDCCLGCACMYTIYWYLTFFLLWIAKYQYKGTGCGRGRFQV